jgi:hypothetical protein
MFCGGVGAGDASYTCFALGEEDARTWREGRAVMVKTRWVERGDSFETAVKNHLEYKTLSFDWHGVSDAVLPLMDCTLVVQQDVSDDADNGTKFWELELGWPS